MKTTARSVAMIAAALALSPLAVPVQAAGAAEEPKVDGARFRALLTRFVSSPARHGDDSDDSNDFDDSNDRYVMLVDDSDDSDDATNFVNNGVGLLSIKKNDAGRFTGKLTLGKDRFRLRGRFRTDQARKILRKRGREIEVSLSLDEFSDLSGTVRDTRGTFSSGLNGGVRASGRRRTYPQRGKYTVVFPGDDLSLETGVPKGDGFGVMKVSRRGRARIVGSLADGTKLSVGLQLTGDGQMPFHRVLYRGRGSIAGLVAFEEDPGVSDAHGTLRIFKPAGVKKSKRYPEGFLIHTPFVASRYRGARKSRVLPEFEDSSGAAIFSFGEGNLSDDLIQPVSITTGNKVLVPFPPDVPMEALIKPRSGLFSGSFTADGALKPTKFRGVFLQQQAIGAGFFLDETDSGFVRVSPSP